MNEPIEQSGNGETDQAQARRQSAQLTDRLMSRYTEPVGVINTRHPQRIHARTAGWVAQRFALLDHWRTRYSDDESQEAPRSRVGQGAGDFALPSSPLSAMRERLAASPSVPQISRSIAPASAVAPRSSTRTSSTPASPMMRVMRRALGSADSPLAPLASGARTGRKPDAPPTETQPARIGAGAEPAKGDSTPLTPANAGGEIGEAKTVAQRKSHGENNSGVTAAQPLLLRATELPSTTTVAGRVQRKLSETAPGLPVGRIIGGSATDATIQRMPLSSASPVERRSDETRPEPSLNAGPAMPPIQTDRKPVQPARVSQLPFAGVAIQRQAVSENTGGQSSGQIQRDASGATVSQTHVGKPALAAEISTASLPKPGMIWRMSESDSSAASQAQTGIETLKSNALVIARQSDGGSSDPVGISPPTSSPVPSESAGGGVDVGQLAESVGRLLARQLQIERERRGMF
jgi:hypothetical protein